jgi:hypothetical protein
MNAKEEFLKHIEDVKTTFSIEGSPVQCAEVVCEQFGKDKVIAFLKTNHSSADFEEFLDLLDFEYDNGYGGQRLFGTIWHHDGTWSSRGEYDGSEWWDHNRVPAIPVILI